MDLQQSEQRMDCDVAMLLAMTGGGSKIPRNDRLGHKITRIGAITGMAGLRRRYTPRNDGAGASLSVMTVDQIIYYSKVTTYTIEIKCQTTA